MNSRLPARYRVIQVAGPMASALVVVVLMLAAYGLVNRREPAPAPSPEPLSVEDEQFVADVTDCRAEAGVPFTNVRTDPAHPKLVVCMGGSRRALWHPLRQP